MSAILTLTAKAMQELCDTLAYLLPNKNEPTPIGLQLCNGQLQMTLQSGFIATYCQSVDSTDEWSTTFLYKDLSACMDYDEDYIWELNEYGVSINTSSFQCEYTIGYSIVEQADFSEFEYKEIPEIKESALKNLLKMNLSKLYTGDIPIYIRDGIAIVKYPCLYVQAAVTEPYNGVSLTQDHWNIITRLKPDRYSQDNSRMLVVGKGAWNIMLPCVTSQQDNNFKDLLEGMSRATMTNFHQHAEKVKTFARMKEITHCKVALYTNGMSTTATSNNTKAVLNTGCTTGEVEYVFDIPVAVWLTLLTAVGDSMSELLIGGSKICLRNNTIAMLLRVAA